MDHLLEQMGCYFQTKDIPNDLWEKIILRDILFIIKSKPYKSQRECRYQVGKTYVERQSHAHPARGDGETEE